ncbi:type I polyketide synthase [Plastoroseomonas arctica]|uniref:SDR family NAD(P)-dependent oxidoreductase n=1 Tax=Plastoroseomonas arctica TaxID=1509237 RepID=A0AAF1JV42_9PROT|nr:type I polyketide synthase [Plastoroseomonas arctica]MBR0654352.1 SDR family NAD(P)-dependent oxidoreductase [Plastoroseomonas arctica]
MTRSSRAPTRGTAGGRQAARTTEPLAIVGAACRLPGAPDLAAFARLLAEGRDAVTEVPEDRFAKARFLHPRRGEPSRSYSFAAGIIGDVLGFDAAAFGLSPREAEEMDPQQRILLEVAQHAFDDAGWPVDRLAGRAIGVFIGASSHDHAELRLEDPAAADRFHMTGSAMAILANRIGHVFDLRGPAAMLDTACSSSLVALDAAANALAADPALEAAVVGGVNLLLSPYAFMGFSRAGMLSPTGRCRAFAAEADGYVRAEGAGVIIVKRLRDALADGEAVRATILGTGVNAAGRTIGLSLPNPAAQMALLTRVMARGGITPERVAAFEAHGTGTRVGDPAEAQAIGRVIGQHRARPLPIGSVKTNLGHLEAGSGMAGLLKAMLALETRSLPATLHCATPNPEIDFAGLNLAVATEATPLDARDDAVIGVNSFGFGGTNATAFLGAAPARRVAANTAKAMPPLILSARSAEGLKPLVASWVTALRATGAPNPGILARAAARHRALHPHRLVLRGEGIPERLAAWLRDGRAEGIAEGTAARGTLAFVFAGNGAQYAGMAREALRGSPVFRRAVADADAALGPHLGWSALALLREGVSAEALAATDHAQPLLFAIQYGIVAALAEHGIAPALVLGHSVGEVAAACATGALGLDQAAMLVATRSRHQHARRGVGRMAALGLSAEMAQPLLDACGPGLEIAAFNAPDALTIAGPSPAIARLAAASVEARAHCLVLDLDYAFHAAAMDPVEEALRADLAALAPGPTRLPLISTVSGTLIEGEALDAHYWWRNLRAPVRFDAAIAEATRQGARIFVEIGPNPVLQSYIRESGRAAAEGVATLPSLTRRDNARDPFPAVADRATSQGADPRGARSFAGATAHRALPLTGFARRATRFPITVESARLTQPRRDHPLLGDLAAPGQWQRMLDTEQDAWLGDHRLLGEAVLPAAAIAEMALAAAAAAAHPEAAVLELRNLAILRAVPLEAGRARELRSTLADGAFTLDSRRRLADEPFAQHARAMLGQLPSLPSAVLVTLAARRRVAGSDVATLAARCGLDYGPAFRSIEGLEVDDALGTARATLQLPETAPADAGFFLHPVRLDGAFQALVGLLAERAGGDGLVPVRIGRLCARRNAPPAAIAELAITAEGSRSIAARITLRDATGTPVAVIEDLWLQRLRLPRREPASAHAFRFEALPIPDAGRAPIPALAEAIAAARATDAGLDLSEAALLLDGFAAASAQSVPGATGPLAAALAEAEPLPPAMEIWRAVLADQPALALDLAWFAHAAETLPAALGGAAQVAATLSPDSATHARLAAVLAAAATVLAARWPIERPFRVLELGAGGALTRIMIEALAASGRRILYTGVGTARAGAQPPPRDGVDFAWCVMDAAAEADLVVGLLPGLASPAGTTLAATLRRIAGPNAALFLAEPAPSRLLDFACGQHPGWWDGAAVPDAEAWRGALRQAGWLAVEVAPLVAAPLPVWLIAAEAPPRDDAALAPEPATLVLATQDAWPLAEAFGTPAAITQTPSPAALRGQRLLIFGGEDGSPATLAAITRAAAAAEGSAASLTLILGDAARSPGAAACLALARVLANEMPGLAPRRIALAGLTPHEMPRRLRAELATKGEPEVTLTHEGRLAPRFQPGLPQAVAGRDAVLAVGAPGQIGSLAWRAAAAPPSPGPGEVRLRVEATGLNFRDLMWAQGLLPEEALLDGFAGPTLGMECAGIVEAVGAGVALAPGARVFGFAPAAFATFATTRADALALRPDTLSAAAAATIPVAFLTAAYALETLARIRPGERVLIHGGAGGVGLAALQIARAAGAEVAASAGTAEKRAFLRAAGAALVVDSRDAGFADALRAQWPEGVEVVLNSLAGDAMARSLALLKPFGRFLELGKRDFFEDSRLGMRALRRNIAYHAIDADALPRARPELAAHILGDIAARLAEGALLPLPHRVLPAEAVETAFRALQASTHIGKLVLTPPASSAPPTPDWAPDEEGCYVVTGGTGGFGLEAAKFLAARGAGRLALLSRRGGAVPGADAIIRTLAALGAQASLIACDVTDDAALDAALRQLRAAGPPIRGIIHAAAVFEDAPAVAHDAARYARVMAPKLDAALLLDRLTREDPLDLFLLFSSATTPFGNPGQAAYVAANAGLEALARRRHAEGLPALAVGWGPIADAGVLATGGEAALTLARRLGVESMTAQYALGALPALIAARLPVVHVVRLARDGAGIDLPIFAEPAFARLERSAPGSAAPADLRATLRALPRAEARAALIRLAQEEIARILRLPADAVPADAPLPGLGLDSLGGLELRMGLERRLGVQVPLAAVTEDLTIATLATRIAGAIWDEGDTGLVKTMMDAYEPPESVT